MNLIRLLPIGETDVRLLHQLGVALAAEFTAPWEVLDQTLDPGPAFHVGRQQYFSTEILARMQDCRWAGSWRLLGVTSLDLYIPILTFVFGEAQLNGACALVSTYRLRQEFYGFLPTRSCCDSAFSRKLSTNSATPCRSRIARTIAAPWPRHTLWNGSISKARVCVRTAGEEPPWDLGAPASSPA